MGINLKSSTECSSELKWIITFDEKLGSSIFLMLNLWLFIRIDSNWCVWPTYCILHFSLDAHVPLKRSSNVSLVLVLVKLVPSMIDLQCEHRRLLHFVVSLLSFGMFNAESVKQSWRFLGLLYATTGFCLWRKFKLSLFDRLNKSQYICICLLSSLSLVAKCYIVQQKE